MKRPFLRNIGAGLLIGSIGLLTLLCVLGPFYWIILSSLRTTKDILSRHINLLPTSLTVANYVQLLQETQFLKNFSNSVVITGVTLLATLLLATLGAYSIRRFDFRGKSFLQRFLLLTYLFPGVILLIPLYVLFSRYGLINTPWAPTAAYVAFCAPFSVWLLESFFHAIPPEVEEAAVLEGASRLQVLYKVFVPLIGPGLVSIGIFTFIYAWSDYMFAVIFLNEESKMTLTIGLELFMSVVRMQWGLVAAGAVGVVLPVMVFFAFFGNRFIKNMTEGVIK